VVGKAITPTIIVQKSLVRYRVTYEKLHNLIKEVNHPLAKDRLLLIPFRVRGWNKTRAEQYGKGLKNRATPMADILKAWYYRTL